MKAFIAGIITLSLLIGAVVANAFLIMDRTKHLILALERLPDDPLEADVPSFAKAWEDSRSWISLTVHRDNVDEIDDTIEQLKLYWQKGNVICYLSAKEKLLCTVERLKKTESFSLSRIF